MGAKGGGAGGRLSRKQGGWVVLEVCVWMYYIVRMHWCIGVGGVKRRTRCAMGYRRERVLSTPRNNGEWENLMLPPQKILRLEGANIEPFRCVCGGVLLPFFSGFLVSVKAIRQDPQCSRAEQAARGNPTCSAPEGRVVASQSSTRQNMRAGSGVVTPEMTPGGGASENMCLGRFEGC